MSAAQQIAGGWQPIETAPKDGTNILLTNGAAVSQGLWECKEPFIREQRDLEGRYLDQQESDGYEGWIDCVGGMLPEPTHWIPLPAAPDAAPVEPALDTPAPAAEPERQSKADSAMQACITYVIHGDADFSDVDSGLAAYFCSAVDERREVPAAHEARAPVAWGAPDGLGGVEFNRGWMFSPVQTAGATVPLYTGPAPEAIEEAFERGRQQGKDETYALWGLAKDGQEIEAAQSKGYAFLVEQPDGATVRKQLDDIRDDDLVVFDGPGAFASAEAAQRELDAEIEAAGGFEAWQAKHAAAPAVREPLTGAEIGDEYRRIGYFASGQKGAFECGVRFAERLHGIQGKP